ncbi:MAG: chromosome segregation protein SMC [Elusimicrobiota bacterium]|jgi:chromosome segregation protein|nr:chromosome segregation protein SMC [Elusimicrobiota bacterium]
MYLKKIELCGFKSFADKTELLFDKGITGIVGPNGCGKSNISDAVRWCLGENRAGVFRIKHMDDLIFGGTQTRLASGMAEVSLFFDNASNVLPIDYSEAVITRKSFKNGENEYYINKSRCRLKDIRDLFLDTGIAFDGYAIMEQEKVSLLTDAKPQDRRDFFEDVAGIATYRAKREETIKRLERVEQDMDRLKDTMDIWQEQLVNCERAAKKAQTAKKYKENLEKYEIASLVRQVSYGISEIERFKNDLAPKEKALQINKTSMARLSAEIAESRIEIDSKNGEIMSLNGSLSSINSQIAVSDEVSRHNLQRENEITAEQEALSAEIEENKTKSLECATQLASFDGADISLPVEVENLEKSFKEQEGKLNAVKSVIIQSQNQQDYINAQLDEIDIKTDSLLKEREQITDRHIYLQTEIAALERLISRLGSETEPSNNEIASIKSEIDRIKAEIDLNNLQKDKLDKTIQDSIAEIGLLENELDSIKEKIISNESKIETLKDYDKKDPIRSAIRNVINLSMARGPISALITAQPGKEEIAAAALGEKLNYLICANAADAEKAIAFLEENDLPRLSFIIADRAEALFSNQTLSMPADSFELTKILNFKEEDEKIIRFVCAGAIVANNKIYSQALVQGGGKTLGADTVLIEERINRAEEENEKLNSSLEPLKERIDSLQVSMTDIKIERDKLFNETIKLGAQIDAKNSLLDEKFGDIKVAAEEIDKHKGELQSAQSEFGILDAKLDLIESELLKLSEAENDWENQLNAVEDSIENSSAEEDELTASFMRARSAFDIKSAQLNNEKQGRQYLEDNIANINQQIENGQKKFEENTVRIAEIRETQENETVKIQDFYEQKAQLESQVREAIGEKEKIQRDIDAKEESYGKMADAAADLAEDIGIIQTNIKNFEFQRANLTARLLESYGKKYEEIRDEFINIEADQDEINRIKRKIESLGDINYGAQKEYEELEQRRDFYDSQRQDLLKSKEDLLEAVRKLNHMTVSNFQQTFGIVREHFKTVYRKLFGGGEADLILTDEENLLESGIDIFAQPPGKKLINISLYSGGEKALTAIALLFAFFMIKPSPFCILDEVDGPLDDANLGRLLGMLKDFAQNTQFLMITHHKRTMEAADILHGVTMEEQGVSKIISHKIKQVEQEA